ncbi:lytic transglycosylase domain-containing protein [Parerythrobacter aurantius]|uniref:lytic transglycosylase domain-containing protein n=1 Tax=Parerythrobacter aurantius TaxID=3127706 RepID=UPI003249FECD
MEGSVILVRSGRLAFFAVLALASAPLRADVLEIGEEGARWVVGGPVAASSVEAMAAAYPGGPDSGLSIGVGSPYSGDLPRQVISDPSLTALGVPPAYQAAVQELSRRFDLSPSLIEALVWQESRWRQGAVSSAGARGLAQLMPGTARYLGVNPYDPYQNLEGGARYLREQLDRFDGDLEKALAAYNAGPGRVIDAGGIPNIRETRLYVAAIIGRLSDHSRKVM